MLYLIFFVVLDALNDLWGTHAAHSVIHQLSVVVFDVLTTSSTAYQWALLSGSTTPNMPPVYGTQGVQVTRLSFHFVQILVLWVQVAVNSTNTPGGDISLMVALDTTNTYWVFGTLFW